MRKLLALLPVLFLISCKSLQLLGSEVTPLDRYIYPGQGYLAGIFTDRLTYDQSIRESIFSVFLQNRDSGSYYKFHMGTSQDQGIVYYSLPPGNYVIREISGSREIWSGVHRGGKTTELMMLDFPEDFSPEFTVKKDGVTWLGEFVANNKIMKQGKWTYTRQVLEYQYTVDGISEEIIREYSFFKPESIFRIDGSPL